LEQTYETQQQDKTMNDKKHLKLVTHDFNEMDENELINTVQKMASEIVPESISNDIKSATTEALHSMAVAILWKKVESRSAVVLKMAAAALVMLEAEKRDLPQLRNVIASALLDLTEKLEPPN
tara:strand:- start:436 stop:804 length:369 start_codon:yes stop_codon:yes gene_type:complete